MNGFHLEGDSCYSRDENLLINSNLFARRISSEPIFAEAASPPPLSIVE